MAEKTKQIATGLLNRAEEQRLALIVDLLPTGAERAGLRKSAQDAK
jgi:hypothetical protein